MNSAVQKQQKIEINWPALLAYVLLPTIGISAWTGIFYLVRLVFKSN